MPGNTDATSDEAREDTNGSTDYPDLKKAWWNYSGILRKGIPFLKYSGNQYSECCCVKIFSSKKFPMFFDSKDISSIPHQFLSKNINYNKT